jgi:hypothetical protein
MKKIKDNLWNRVFHNKALKEWKIEIKKLQRIIGWYDNLNQELNEAKTLEDLLNVHKHAWEIGYQNDNIAPLEWGMFRTKDILQMSPSEVYLGGIWGLSTKNIPFWNANKKETMAGNGFGIDENRLIYDLIMQQYRQHLKSNFRAIKELAASRLFG